MRCPTCGEPQPPSWFIVDRANITVCGRCYLLTLRPQAEVWNYQTLQPILETFARIGAHKPKW